MFSTLPLIYNPWKKSIIWIENCNFLCFVKIWKIFRNNYLLMLITTVSRTRAWCCIHVFMNLSHAFDILVELTIAPGSVLTFKAPATAQTLEQSCELPFASQIGIYDSREILLRTRDRPSLHTYYTYVHMSIRYNFSANRIWNFVADRATHSKTFNSTLLVSPSTYLLNLTSTSNFSSSISLNITRQEEIGFSTSYRTSTQRTTVYFFVNLEFTYFFFRNLKVFMFK